MQIDQIVYGIIVSLIFSFSASAAELDVEALYKAGDGPMTVEYVETLEIKDERRDKTLPVRITWPKDEGKYPLIVFSHGALGSKDHYEPLVKHWVSHGYVCIQPTHEDSFWLLSTAERLNTSKIWSKWRSRPADVSFILNSLDAIEQKVPQLRDKIDRDRIGVGGHSFGAHTSQLIGGVQPKDPSTGKLQSYADERPKVLLLISPQGTGSGLVPESWKGLKRPAMIITGTNDKSPRTGESYEWRMEVFEHSPPGGKYLIFIDEAYHGFGGITGQLRLPASGPENADHVAIVKSTTIALWDTYLKESRDAQTILTGDNLSKATGGSARVTVKD